MKINTNKLLMLPGPTIVPPEVLNAMSFPVIGHRSKEFSELFEDTVEKLKKVFITENDTFIITGSGTSAMDMAISNIVSKGDKVLNIITGNFGERFSKIVEAYKGESIKYEVEWGDMADPKRVKELLEENEEIKAVTVVHNETSTGAKNLIEEIGKVVKDFNTLYIVDTVSSLGGDYVNVDKFNIDICVTGSQKCLAAPPGLAGITVSEKAWEVIEKNDKVGFYLDLKTYKKYYEEKRQNPYTPAVNLIYALNVALDLILEEGIENRVKRHERLARATQEAIMAMGLELFAKEKARSITVTSIKYPEGIDDKLREILNKKYNIVVAGGQKHLSGKIFRIGHMGVCGEKEILATISCLELALKELGFEIKESGVERALEVLGK
ncbi:aminotransferase class V [Methanocaldococcus infernus ME]|uniref:Aminotransferase class V n=1 Tax=Methanocaldococcus infernus (strain DSM 11812 / JCM 15783 / ME) TaxID=573063 RepID=D5VTU5_METIM|nr:alanine--glyoxylate aminotransferase family protein [Methanocaldococcus infernus]ADG13998.1 aminotransferase class V [Methanocaldococcus infernus ME]